MNRERLEVYSNFTITAVGVIFAIFLIVKYLLIPTVPFLIAWAVAFMLRPASVYLSKKTHIPRKPIAAFLTVFTVLVGLGAVIALISVGVKELWQFLVNFANEERIGDILSKIANPIKALFGGENSGQIENQILGVVKDSISALLGEIVEIISGVISSVPRVFFFILITVIASIYFSVELDSINSFIKKKIPCGVYSALRRIKSRFFFVGIKYLKAYLILMSFTFFIMLVGLLILRVKNSLLLALVIAALDLLPILGVGTVLVPWSAFEILFGDFRLGVGLAVLFLVNEIIREVAEPKIIGRHLGIHPIVSLILIYVGYWLFGIVGLILAPIIGSLFGLLFKKEDSPEVREDPSG